MYLGAEKLTVTSYPLSSGSEGTRETLQFMRKLIREGRKHPDVRAKALELVRPFQQKNYRREINALFDFVKNNIRYVRDTRGVELLHQPDKLLQIEQGDCDDKVILLCSLLESIGHPTRIEAIAHVNPEKFGHVYCSSKLGSKWVTLDPTEDVKVGWKPSKSVKRLILNT